MTKTLNLKAYRVFKNSYSPYSNFKVGCSLVSVAGNTYVGTNVENASFGGTICAERSAIFSGVSNEGPLFKIKEIVIVSSTVATLPPCAMCLQVISEFCTKDTQITFLLNGELVTKTLQDLLPIRFDFTSLPK
jgi:cytidine deaminase